MSVCGGKILQPGPQRQARISIRAAVQPFVCRYFNNMVRGSAWGLGASPQPSEIHQYHLCIPGCADDQERVSMIIDRKVSSIESSFQMDSMLFDEECRRRVKDVLSKNTSAVDVVEELNRKYSVLAQKMEDQ